MNIYIPDNQVRVETVGAHPGGQLRQEGEAQQQQLRAPRRARQVATAAGHQPDLSKPIKHNAQSQYNQS